ncbi:autoinducer binding domain-containing protein, partial [Pseudomonas aeruginosa]|uniref:autoinducer binding domain-containing protein n=1 Tax=Pseudomonas aeruginosa TaxID=287 RepID=UPI003CC50697
HGDGGVGRSAQQRVAYLLLCPDTRHILELDEPLFWSKSPSEDPEGMTYGIVRGVRVLGLVNGLQVPVFGRNGLEG